MADPNEVSQFIIEAAAEDGSDEVSQLIAEVAPTTGPDRISQFIAEAAPTTGPDQLSQFITEAAPTTGPDQVSQITIELLRGPEVIPPEDAPTEVFTFDAGLGNEYFLALQLSDSGIESRDKCMKSIRVTGKLGDAAVKGYGYGPRQEINVDDIERGVNYRVRVTLESSSQVQQSKRHPVNVPNSMMHTVRVEGRWNGQGARDSIHEIYYEVSQQGVRR